MAGEISRAIDRLEERKNAAGMRPEVAGEETGDEMTRRIWSGLDIDLDEVHRLKREIAECVLGGIAEGNHPVVVGTGMWFDGVATELLITEARAKAEAPA